ncbi:hypothetical protein [Synechococcus sp. MIT S9220]|uniref:hypothetical protein n=1 Tax=Synechococcus sp. MIT S9220 TaxID=166309 RepID=UPI00164CADFA|nr:hypothetical protein [Synechococcus sp. MIT S9220]
MASCASPKSIVSTYLKSPVDSKKRYDTICEKDVVSLSEFREYYSPENNSDIANWTTENIKFDSKAGRYTYISADHEIGSKTQTSIYKTFKKQNGEYCVLWTSHGRVIGDLSVLIRYPETKITAFLPVELSDYYNYDFNNKERSHMALTVLDSSLKNNPTIYIPYNGNEKLYQYIKTADNPVIKGVVSREYTLDLDTEKVDQFNKSLRNLKTLLSQYDTGEDIEYMGYKRSYVTDDSSILYMPTAIPVTASASENR